MTSVMGSRVHHLIRTDLEHSGQEAGRSSLFRWLVRHHDQVMAASSESRLNWLALSTHFAAQGLTDSDGKAATPETTRQTWKRVRRYVLQQRTTREAESPFDGSSLNMSVEYPSLVASPLAPLTKPASASRGPSPDSSGDREDQVQSVVGSLLRSSDRSPVFWWLVEHHEQVAAAVGEGRIRWSVLSAQFTALGLTDRNGNAATPQATRQTWWKVRRYVLQRAAPRPPQDARSEQLRVQAARPVSTPVLPASAPAFPPVQQASADGSVRQKLTPEQRIERINQQLRERSGRFDKKP